VKVTAAAHTAGYEGGRSTYLVRRHAESLVDEALEDMRIVLIDRPLCLRPTLAWELGRHAR
jgi:hypothetical protein